MGLLPENFRDGESSFRQITTTCSQTTEPCKTIYFFVRTERVSLFFKSPLLRFEMLPVLVSLKGFIAKFEEIS